MRQARWLTEISEKKPTRYASGKQETKIAKSLGGRKTCNSGAKFNENDVITDYAEIECKTTAADSFTVKFSDWDKLRKKCKADKIPMMVFELQNRKKNFVLLSLEDFAFLVENQG